MFGVGLAGCFAVTVSECADMRCEPRSPLYEKVLAMASLAVLSHPPLTCLKLADTNRKCPFVHTCVCSQV